MKQINNKKTEYNYTDEFNKNATLHMIVNHVKAFLPFLIFILLVPFEGKEPIIIEIYFLFIIIPYFVWFVGFSNFNREFEKDRIFIENDIIYFDREYNYKNGGVYRTSIISNIRKVIVTNYSIIIYGNIISTIIDSFDFTIRHKKIKIPNRLKNSEEFFKFLDDKVIEYEKASAYDKKDEDFHGKNIDRFNILKCIKKPLFSLTKKYIYVIIISLIITILSIYLSIFNDVREFYILLMLSLYVFGTAFAFLMVYGLKDYLLDILFKKLCVYRGYVDKIDRISRLPYVPFARNQYSDCFSIIMQNKKEYNLLKLPDTRGDLLSNPIGGRRFIIKDKEVLKNFDKNKEIEIIYLKHSKIIISVNKGLCLKS